MSAPPFGPHHPHFPHKPVFTQPLHVQPVRPMAMQSTASFASNDTVVNSPIKLYGDKVPPPPSPSIDPKIIRGWADGMKARMDNVNALAVVATFLAAVQAQLISFTYESNSSSLQRATNAISFLGLSFDIIGTAMGLISALTMQPDQQHLNQAVFDTTQAYAEWMAISRELDQVAQQETLNSGRSIPQHLMNDHVRQQRERMVARHLLETRKKSWLEEDACRAEELEELRKGIIVGNIKGLAPQVFMAFGIVCFFLALLGFVGETQPRVVWVPTLIAVVFGASILPVDALLHSRRTRAKLARLWRPTPSQKPLATEEKTEKAEKDESAESESVAKASV